MQPPDWHYCVVYWRGRVWVYCTSCCTYRFPCDEYSVVEICNLINADKGHPRNPDVLNPHSGTTLCLETI